MEPIISAAEALENFDELMRQVVAEGAPVTVERGDEPAVVLISASSYRQLLSTQQGQFAVRAGVSQTSEQHRSELNRRALPPDGGKGIAMPDLMGAYRRELPPGEEGAREQQPLSEDHYEDLIDRYWG